MKTSIYEKGQGMKEVYNTIKQYINENGYPPTVREIGEICGFTSPATVQYHLIRLEQQGYIQKQDGKSRAIKILK